MKCTVVDGKVCSGRDNIEMVAIDPHSLDRLKNGHRGMTREQVHHHAFVGGVEVLDQDEGHAAIGRQRVQKASAGVKTPCRSANSHDEEVIGIFRRTSGQPNPSAR